MAVCRHCRKPIAKTASGVWAARKRDDPHPFYCDGDPGAAKLHAPGPPPLTEGTTTEGTTA